MDYWIECTEEALEEAGLKATNDQIRAISEFIEGAHDSYGMAFGHDCIPNPLQAENNRLEKELSAEKSKIECDICHGVGRIISPGPCHSIDSGCWKCRGEGRIAP